MDNPGLLIAVDMILLYLVLGPVVLFGFYVFFDKLGQSQSQVFKKKKDMALLTPSELKFVLKQGQKNNL
ncbi:MAG: hypothetical protein RBR08_06530 [Desulforegulaceae bacterium]|nr:hypothetical protein [Desulforegulaceae bacterium]